VSDVSAVILSIGEPYTARARASVASQTLPVAEVILVENVSPFFRALNEAARRVRTAFFVQVDADMILDSTCVEALRAEVLEDTGIAVGELRDPLLGQVVGVKLFRTECFKEAGFRDSITPDTDFAADIGRMGWKTLYVGIHGEDTEARPLTFGEHRPDYTPAYTYRKHLLEGCRLRYRGAQWGLRWRFGRLGDSPHPLAGLAQIALAHGIFLPAEHDQLTPWTDEPDAARLMALLGSDRRFDAPVADLFPFTRHHRLGEVYDRFARAGHELARADAGGTIRDTLAAVSGTQHAWHGLVAKIALCHGILSPAQTAESLAADKRVLGTLVTLGIGRRVGLWQHLRASAARQVRKVWRPRETIRW
jgi:hypothetical protein